MCSFIHSFIHKQPNCKKDNCEKALSYDKHSAGVFKKDGTLLDHIPIELSRLIYYFMKENKENFISALLVGPRKLEVGVVIPAKFTAFTKELRFAITLSAEILKIKTGCTHF